MQYTLWRGTKLISRAELTVRRKDPFTIVGSVEITPALEELGPLFQYRVQREGGTAVIQQVLPRAADIPTHFGSGDLELVEIWASDEQSPQPPSPILPEHLLTLRDENNAPVDVDTMWLLEPPTLPAEFIPELNDEILKRFSQWRLLCHLINRGAGAA